MFNLDEIEEQWAESRTDHYDTAMWAHQHVDNLFEEIVRLRLALDESDKKSKAWERNYYDEQRSYNRATGRGSSGD